MEINKDEECKVKALKDSIVEECRKQGFTYDEFVRLVSCLSSVYYFRRFEILKNSKI